MSTAIQRTLASDQGTHQYSRRASSSWTSWMRWMPWLMPKVDDGAGLFDSGTKKTGCRQGLERGTRRRGEETKHRQW